uniref:hypothetical protein n=1 Tax=Zhouia sp. PK063 TaxID=3373602 RepID=UPI0037DCC8C8
MKDDKEIDDLTRKSLHKASVISPSENFELQIMQQLKPITTTSFMTGYKPLISKRIGTIIGTVLILIWGIVISQISYNGKETLWDKFIFSKITIPSFNISWIHLQIPEVVTFSITLLSVLTILELLFLKKFTAKKLL